MAGRDEIVDTIAGFAMFADLQTPQLQAVAGLRDEPLASCRRAQGEHETGPCHGAPHNDVSGDDHDRVLLLQTRAPRQGKS